MSNSTGKDALVFHWIRKKTRLFTLTTTTKHGIGGPSECQRARKRKKRHADRKG